MDDFGGTIIFGNTHIYSWVQYIILTSEEDQIYS